MQNDRSFYRMCGDKRLINEVFDAVSSSSVNWEELAIALAERLQDVVLDGSEDQNDEIAKLEALVDDLRDQLIEANETINFYETQETAK